MSTTNLGTTPMWEIGHFAFGASGKLTEPDVPSSHSRQDSGNPSNRQVAASSLDSTQLSWSADRGSGHAPWSSPTLQAADTISSLDISDEVLISALPTASHLSCPGLELRDNNDNNNTLPALSPLSSSYSQQARAVREAHLLPQIAALELQIQGKRQHIRLLKTQRQQRQNLTPSHNQLHGAEDGVVGEPVAALQLQAQIMHCEQSVRANARQLKELRKQRRMLTVWGKEEERRGRQGRMWEKIRSSVMALWEVNWL
nr:hypothetical protein CFP56_54891 [Quercus suber]